MYELRDVEESQKESKLKGASKMKKLLYSLVHPIAPL